MLRVKIENSTLTIPIVVCYEKYAFIQKVSVLFQNLCGYQTIAHPEEVPCFIPNPEMNQVSMLTRHMSDVLWKICFNTMQSVSF